MLLFRVCSLSVCILPCVNYIKFIIKNVEHFFVGNLGSLSLIVLSDIMYAMIVSLSSLTCLSVQWCGVVWYAVPFRSVSLFHPACLVLYCRVAQYGIVLFYTVRCSVLYIGALCLLLLCYEVLCGTKCAAACCVVWC